MTEAEFRLWLRIRDFEPRFRRQVPVGQYIVDFLCPATRLIVEIDGSQHMTPHRLKADLDRTAWLQGKGYALIRLTNLDVKENIEGAFERVAAEVQARSKIPPPETG